MAIWALVIGIFSPLCCVYSGPVAIGLGIGSLNRIKSSQGDVTGQAQLTGRGMAIAGIVLGALATVLLIVQLMLFAASPTLFDVQ